MTFPARFLSPNTMPPTVVPALSHSSNSPSVRQLHHLRRQLGLPHRPLGQPSVSRTEQFKPRILDLASQPPLVLEGPTSPSFSSTPSQSVVLASEPSTAPVADIQPESPSPSGDIPGNIVVVVVVMVLILGGLIGLIFGGEVLRREAKTSGKISPAPSKCVGRRKPKTTKNATAPTPQSTKSAEKFPYDEKTLTPLMQPPPALSRGRQRKLSDVWPIRALSRVLGNRRSSQDARSCQQPALAATPQTTWSEFSPVSLYAAPPRTLLPRILEEHEEDSHDVGVDVLHRLLEYNPAVSPPQRSPGSMHNTSAKGYNEAQRRDARGAKAKDEDTKSLGSCSAPDMTADCGESSRSSTMSLESVNEEEFELRRAQTRSMQMNKGVLLSLSAQTLPENGTGRSSRPASTVSVEMRLGMFGGSFSGVNLDEFPSPPSVLPVIPSFVSGF